MTNPCMRDNCANATAAMRVPDMARPCLFRHAAPPGLAVGEPDDRLLRGIQYAVLVAVILIMLPTIRTRREEALQE